MQPTDTIAHKYTNAQAHTHPLPPHTQTQTHSCTRTRTTHTHTTLPPPPDTHRDLPYTPPPTPPTSTHTHRGLSFTPPLTPPTSKLPSTLTFSRQASATSNTISAPGLNSPPRIFWRTTSHKGPAQSVCVCECDCECMCVCVCVCVTTSLSEKAQAVCSEMDGSYSLSRMAIVLEFC